METKLFLAFALILGAVPGQTQTFLTWNSQGARWAQVANFLGHYDVLCIQEAGVFPTNLGPLTPIRPFISLIDDDIVTDITDFDGGVHAYSFIYNNANYYMYYYHHPVDDAETRRLNRDRSTQNMAIITREAATHVYIILPHSNYEHRIDTNRPTIGLRLAEYNVFTTHTDPKAHRNEINTTIQKVSRLMQGQCDQRKWILMGDFNAEPPRIVLPAVPAACFIDLVFPTQVTKPNRRHPNGGTIIDFGIYGGPSRRTSQLRAQTLGNFGSDHLPVSIYPVVNNG